MKHILEPGKIVKGKVSGIKPFGIFVHLEGGYSGMIHISEVSDQYVKDLNEYAKLGEMIPCRILEIDEKNKKIKLTIKNMDYELRRETKENENFKPLKEKFPTWIDTKLEELKK